MSENMKEYLELGQQLARRIEGINARLNTYDYAALECLQVALIDSEMYLRGLELLSFLEELRQPEKASV